MFSLLPNLISECLDSSQVLLVFCGRCQRLHRWQTMLGAIRRPPLGVDAAPECTYIIYVYLDLWNGPRDDCAVLLFRLVRNVRNACHVSVIHDFARIIYCVSPVVPVAPEQQRRTPKWPPWPAAAVAHRRTRGDAHFACVLSVSNVQRQTLKRFACYNGLGRELAAICCVLRHRNWWCNTIGGAKTWRTGIPDLCRKLPVAERCMVEHISRIELCKKLLCLFVQDIAPKTNWSEN